MELEVDDSYGRTINNLKTLEQNSKTKKILKRKLTKSQSSSSSSESEDDIEYKKVHEDFAHGIDQYLADIEAKGIAALEPNRLWSKEVEKPKNKSDKDVPLFGKNFNTNILLNRGDDDENYLSKLDKISKVASSQITKVAPELDFLADYNYDSVYTKSKNPREVQIIVADVEDDIKDSSVNSEDSCTSEDEQDEITDNTLLTLNMGRHEDTLRCKSSKRKEKRKEKMERKEREKKEMRRTLKDIKLKEMEEKYEKIRKTNPLILKYLKPEDLDDDFDSDKHNEIMERLFDQDGEDYPTDEEKPVFSDDDICYEDCEYNEDNSSSKNIEEVPVKAKKVKPCDVNFPDVKTKHKSKYFVNIESEQSQNDIKPKEIYDRDAHGSFKNFIKKHAPVICDDIIKDGNGEPILCKFKYRSVEPQNFGLSMDEIMMAENKELNKWASLKKVVSIRSHDQEMRDAEHYQSERKLSKKKDILLSVYADEGQIEVNKEEDQNDDEATESKISKASKKRLRKTLNKNKLRDTLASVPVAIDVENTKEEIQNGEEKKAHKIIIEKSEKEVKDQSSKSKKAKAKKSRTDMPVLESGRLQSYGVSEGYYRFGLNVGKSKKKNQ